MTNGEKFIEVFGYIAAAVFDTKDNMTTIRTLGNWWDERYIQSNSDGNCISREQAIRIAEQGQLLGYEWQFKELCKLPSIQPKAKMGNWIEHPHEAGENWEYSKYECSECHAWANDDSDYCPNCGAKISGFSTGSTTKSDLAVDCIDRDDMVNYVKGMLSVTPRKLIHGKCNQCKYYEGVHDVQGHAPCSYHKIGGVMWDWYCSQFESEDKK